MKYWLNMSVIILLISCNHLVEKKVKIEKSFYPYTKKMDNTFNYSLRKNIDNGISISARKDSLNLIYFLSFKNDTIIWKTKKTTISTPFTDAYKISDFYFLLKPEYRTLGKKPMSNYLIIKSDGDFNEIWRKEINIKIYPDTKSLILKKDSSFIYISNNFIMGKKEGLVLREYGLNSNIIKEKLLSATHKYISYRPISVYRIDQNHFIVISDRSKYRDKRISRYEITMFDFNFNAIWTKDIDLTYAKESFLLKKSKRLIIINGYTYEDKSINLYSITGKLIKSFKIPDFDLYDITFDSNDNFYIYVGDKKGNRKVIKLNKDASIIDEKLLIKNNYTDWTNITFADGQIYLYGINENAFFEVTSLKK